jgi:5'-nucleotidase
MNILISNDDGILARGLAVLGEVCESLGQVTVVAPDREQSGTSHSLTLHRPLRATRRPDGAFQLDGTPTDCVLLAIGMLMPQKPDFVISGINHGQNMGEDVFYSGTVAAAMEGYLLGIPAIALSLTNKAGEHFETAGRIARDLVARFIQAPMRQPVLLNVNIPDVSYEELDGMEVTRLGKRHKAEPVIKALTPRNEPVYWVGAAGPASDAGPGTDFYAIASNKVSITPLQVDLTHSQQIPSVRTWLAS